MRSFNWEVCCYDDLNSPIGNSLNKRGMKAVKNIFGFIDEFIKTKKYKNIYETITSNKWEVTADDDLLTMGKTNFEKKLIILEIDLVLTLNNVMALGNKRDIEDIQDILSNVLVHEILHAYTYVKLSTLNNKEKVREFLGLESSDNDAKHPPIWKSLAEKYSVYETYPITEYVDYNMEDTYKELKGIYAVEWEEDLEVFQDEI